MISILFQYHCFKVCTEQLTPTVTEIINLSLSSGAFPEQLKHALVRPLLKKYSLDPEMLKNYPPVSNLSFISKLIEKPICSQINDYLTIICTLNVNLHIVVVIARRLLSLESKMTFSVPLKGGVMSFSSCWICLPLLILLTTESC